MEKARERLPRLKHGTDRKAREKKQQRGGGKEGNGRSNPKIKTPGLKWQVPNIKPLEQTFRLTRNAKVKKVCAVKRALGGGGSEKKRRSRRLKKDELRGK